MSAQMHAPKWERRKESRPAELLSAALDIFVERGYSATRLDDVAARAGVSKGTLYLYFDGKQELFEAVVRTTIVPLIDAHRRGIDESDAAAGELLERFFRDWWNRFGGTRLAGIAKLIIAEATHFPELATFFHREVIRPSRDLLAAIVRRGVERGEFRAVDPEISANLWLAPLVLKAVWACSFDAIVADAAPIDPERFLAAHVDLVRAGLRK
jgi:AcrR family transcriptional regulator